MCKQQGSRVFHGPIACPPLHLKSAFLLSPPPRPLHNLLQHKLQLVRGDQRTQPGEGDRDQPKDLGGDGGEGGVPLHLLQVLPDEGVHLPRRTQEHPARVGGEQGEVVRGGYHGGGGGELLEPGHPYTFRHNSGKAGVGSGEVSTQQ